MAPASTNNFKQRSSIPLVVKTTLAPASRIFLILSVVISISLFKCNYNIYIFLKY